MGEIVLVASGKGGVGKTVFTANLGGILAKRGASVVLIDMNIGLRSLDICLGLENRIVYDITDVLSGICRTKQALIKDRRFNDLYLMSAPQNRNKADISSDQMADLCNELKQSYDYILIDSPAGLGDEFVISAAQADKGVILTVPEHTAIRDADLLDDTLSQFGVNNRSVVVNKIMGSLYKKGIVPDPEEISESLRSPINGLIPYDLNIHISVNIGVPIILAEGSYVHRNFSNITDRILRS